MFGIKLTLKAPMVVKTYNGVTLLLWFQTLITIFWIEELLSNRFYNFY